MEDHGMAERQSWFHEQRTPQNAVQYKGSAARTAVWFRRAAGEVVRCSLETAPPQPRWQLLRRAGTDQWYGWQARLASGQLSTPASYGEAESEVVLIDAIVSNDETAPKDVRESSALAFMLGCRHFFPPQNQEHYKEACERVRALHRPNDPYLLRFVEYADQHAQ